MFVTATLFATSDTFSSMFHLGYLPMPPEIYSSFSFPHLLQFFRQLNYKNLFTSGLSCYLASTSVTQWDSLAGDEREDLLRLYCPSSFPVGSHQTGYSPGPQFLYQVAFSIWLLVTNTLSFSFRTTGIHSAQWFPALVYYVLFCVFSYFAHMFYSLSLFRTCLDLSIFQAPAISCQHLD